jgi:GNAT superfamily N-acetyltransferase
MEWAKALTLSEIESELAVRLRVKSTSSDILLSVTDEDEITGYCSVHWIPTIILPGIEGYVSELFIGQKHRGQGIGESLLQEIERRARSKGAYRLSLLNLKDKESYKRGFYAKRNWVERVGAANMIRKLREEK